MTTLSNLYNATFKEIRGKAAQGFIRPTLSEFFMSHKDFVEIESAAGGWIRTLAGGNGHDIGRGITTDSSDNIYVTGYWDNGPDYDIFITKYNSSGAIQWQRTLAGGNGTDYAYGITTDSSDNIYVTGYWDNGPDYDTFITKLPNDGSGTGTYGNFTYAEGSLTDSAGSLTDSAGSLTDSAGSLTDSAGSLTDSAGSLTEGTPYEIE
jgi:hypothetical protein